MRCPRCDFEIEMAWSAIRKARRALKQCAGCGVPSVLYRCVECRAKQSADRKRRNEQESEACSARDNVVHLS